MIYREFLFGEKEYEGLIRKQLWSQTGEIRVDSFVWNALNSYKLHFLNELGWYRGYNRSYI